MPVALVTGGSAGLGRALVTELANQGWLVITDGRRPAAFSGLADRGIVVVPGDVTDAEHRAALVAEVEAQGRLDLLVHNASTLGPTPLPALGTVKVADLQDVWRTNVGAPIALTAALLPRLLAARGVLVSVSSDAAIEHYPGWGLYGASKAGLDHVMLTFGAENEELTAYAVDPGDMRTAMQQAAFPGEDISDRPLPETVVPHLLALLETRPPSGRYRAADLAAPARAGG
jgi:NAD(P)-dependent dehydrogenase (short-subunit alcohol dehydrogenase family)